MSTPTHRTLTDAPVRPVRSNAKPAKTSADQAAVRQPVAITATGPIYRRQQVFALLPLSVALALTQEVASRVLYPRRQVVSSLANRVSGESARQVWQNLCASIAGPLANAPLNFRHQYLRAVLAYVWQQKNVNGIEPVLCAAINAVAPAMSNVSLAPLLSLSQRYLSESEFQAREPMAILDPATRTATGFAAGSLAKLDLTKWLDWRAIGTDVGRSGGMGATNGLLGPGQAGYYGVDLSGLQGADGQTPNRGSSGSGPSDGGLLGPGMPGYNGVDLSGLRGPDGSRVGGGGTAGGGMSGIDGLLGPGQAGYGGIDLSGLRGANGQGIGTYGGLGNTSGGTPDILGEGGLLGPGAVGRPGSSIDLSNLHGNGGPYGFGPNLSAGGAADGWGDVLKSVGSSGKALGLGLMALGGGAVISGAGIAVGGQAAENPAAIAGGGTVAQLGAYGFVIGGVIFLGGAAVEAAGAYGTPSAGSAATPTPAPAPSAGSGTSPAPSSQEPAIGIPVITHPPAAAPAPSTGTTATPAPAPSPDPGTPKDSDVYPDPNGKGDGKTGIWDENGGGGNPTTIWDDNQGGSGNPAAMWDEFGHGGNPNSIWDEHGGGGNPTTIWDENGGGVGPTRAQAFAVAKVLSGPGMEARLVRVGPRTMAI